MSCKSPLEGIQATFETNSGWTQNIRVLKSDRLKGIKSL